MSLDWLMCLIALLVLSKDGLVISFWMVVNISLITIIDHSTYLGWFDSVALWAALFSIKDFVFITILSAMRAPVTIVACLFASCIFHQLLRFQIMTYNYSNLTLLDYRSTFMLWLSVIMLATLMTNLINGGGNGGKRAKHFMPNRNHCFFRIRDYSSCKVIK